MKSKTTVNVTFGLLAVMTAFVVASTQPTQRAFAQAEPAATPEVSLDQPNTVDTVDKGEVQVPPTEVITKTDAPADVSNETFFQSLLNAIGQFKGAKTLAIVLIVVQLLIQLMKTPLFTSWMKSFKFWDDGWKLVFVSGLTCVATVVPLVIEGMGWGAAAVSAVSLAAFQVFFHQLFIKVFNKKDTVTTPATAA